MSGSQHTVIEEAQRQADPESRTGHLRMRRVFQLVRKRAGRLFVTFFVLSLLFAGLAIIQHRFVHAQLFQLTRRELGAWGAEIVSEVSYRDKWDLPGYRRASMTAERWYILTKKGLLIDIEGFIPNLFGQVQVQDAGIYNAPKTVVTAAGESWRLFGRKLTDGVVIVGECSPDATTDSRLLANAAKFGSSVGHAAATKSREIDFEVEYAVIGSDGQLKADLGGVPLKADPHALPVPVNRIARFTSNGKHYLLYFQPILNERGAEVGQVVLPKDIDLEEAALKAQDRFNIGIVGLMLLAACAAGLWLIVQEFSSQPKCLTLEEALKAGESRKIEFKSTFQWDVHRNLPVEDRKIDTLKSIAGFLNAKGGTLFIGVTEETNPPTVRGLDDDLMSFGGSKDRLQRCLRDLITARIGPEFSPFITDELQEANGRVVWVVTVGESPEPAFVRWKPSGESKEQKKFYVREGPKTSDLDNERTWHYIKNKWG